MKKRLIEMDEGDLKYMLENSPSNVATYLMGEVKEMQTDLRAIRSLVEGRVDNDKILAYIDKYIF